MRKGISVVQSLSKYFTLKKLGDELDVKAGVRPLTAVQARIKEKEDHRVQEQHRKQSLFENNERKSLAVAPQQYQLYSRSKIPYLLDRYAPPGQLDVLSYLAAASVLPMRANNYVIDELMDWNNVPDDPIFQLVFPQPGMLFDDDLVRMRHLLNEGATRVTLRAAAQSIRGKMNPHPAGQKELNVPKVAGEELPGMQHKYRETLLFFPTEAQYCHSYCTYCFRWAQFTSVGSKEQFQSADCTLLRKYLRANRTISDVLFTGGDPMVMTSQQWAKYLLPLVNDPELDHISTIRIGSKSLSYWPYRFISDPDADDVLRLFETVVKSGKHLAFMAHFSHDRELSTPAVQEAIRRIHMTGARIRSQAPLINHVNNDPVTWTNMWRAQTRMGIIPYYMFVERDTGAKHYFEVPLVKGLEIYNAAIQNVSGVSRTVRGPSMSAAPGKVHVIGVSEIAGEKVIILKFLQGRNPAWVGKTFFAKFDEEASWLDHLRPAFGEDKFFYEDELNAISSAPTSSGRMFPLKEGFEYRNMIMK